MKPVQYLAANFSFPKPWYVSMPRLFILIKCEVFKPVVVLHTDLIWDIIVPTKKKWPISFKIKVSRLKISLLNLIASSRRKNPSGTTCMNAGNWEWILFSCPSLTQANFSVTLSNVKKKNLKARSFWFYSGCHSQEGNQQSFVLQLCSESSHDT